MKKLYTILSTILIFSLFSIKTYANTVFSNTLNLWQTQLFYMSQNSRQMQYGSCNSNICSNDISGLVSLDSLSLVFHPNEDQTTEHVIFNGYITIQNFVAVGSGQPQELPSISSIGLKSSDNVTTLGVCEFRSINSNHPTLGSVGQSTDSSTGVTYNIYQSTTNFSVDCYLGDTTRLLTPYNYELQFYFNEGQGLNPSKFTVVSLLNYYYASYTGEYDDNLEAIRQAILGIQVGASSQDIINQTQDIINNNNNNTQQIVEQLTSESCSQVPCSNLFHPVNITSSLDNYTYGDSYLILNRRWNGQSLFNGGSFGTFERGKTYYYDIDCTSDYISLIELNFNGSVMNLTCGSGSFVLPNNYGTTLTDIYITNVARLTDYKINFFFSENNDDFCDYGTSQEVCSGSNRLDNINNSITDVNNTLSDSNTDGASTEFQQIIEDFNFNNHGLTSFLLIPVNAAQNLLTATCTPVHLQFPYLNNKSIDLPCYSPIFDYNFLSLMTLIRICTNGIIAYYCVMQIYKMMINLSNPDHANIEVFEL